MKLNLPNKITIFRMILFVPLLAIGISFFYLNLNNPKQNNFSYQNLNNSNSALILLICFGIIFIIAMLSDFLDGYLARKNNQVSEFGKLFDPLADKMITGVALVFLFLIKFSFMYVFIIFFIRDLVVDGFRNVAAKNNLKVAASIWGKIKTIIQSFAIPFLIFICPALVQQVDFENFQVYILNIPLFIAAIFSLVSGYLYIREIFPYILK